LTPVPGGLGGGRGYISDLEYLQQNKFWYLFGTKRKIKNNGKDRGSEANNCQVHDQSSHSE